MKRLVHVRLRHRDIILKTARDRLVHLVNHTKRRIAVLDGIHDDADGEQIIDLVERFILIHHLLINAEKMLRASLNLCHDSRRLDMRAHFLHERLHVVIAHTLALVNLTHKVVVCLRLQIL